MDGWDRVERGWMGGTMREGKGKETHGRGTVKTEGLLENHIETKYWRNFL